MSVERVYLGDTAYFPDLGRWVSPGEIVEFDEAPVDDPRFLTEGQARKHASEVRKAKQSAEPVPEPASPADSEEQS